MKKEKVFILGAGGGQIPIIKLCKSKGFEVIVFSIDPNSPGIQYADKFYNIDIKEKETILSLAKSEQIVGILTDQLDLAVVSVAYVSELLSLPSIGYECSLIFTNKYLMRNRAKNLFIDSPRYFKAESLDEAIEKGEQIGYPIIIKPVDSDGSRGIAKIYNRNDLKENFKNCMKYSYAKMIIIEEFLTGELFEVQGFSQNGIHKNLCISTESYFDIPNIFVPNMMHYIDADSATNEIEKKILDINQKLITGFNLPFGITQSEYLYSKENNRIFLIETAARGGGVYISSDLIPLSCGFDANSLLVDLATDKVSGSIDIKLRSGAASYLCFKLPIGKVISIKNLEKVKKIKGVHKIFIDDIYEGLIIKEMKDKSGRKGPILLYGQTREACLETIEHVKKTLIIEVETENGIRGIEWS